jgi:hypothetical protein
MTARLPEELQKAQKRGVNAAAFHVTSAIRDEIRAATGDMKLSGVGARGAKVGARYNVKGTVNPTAIIRASGPLQLIERDTAPHAIIPRGKRRGKRGTLLKGRKAMYFDDQFRAAVMHPGTRGKHPFEKGYLRSAPHAGAIFDAEIQNMIVRVLA